MSDKKIRIIHLIYTAVTSAALVLLAILLVISCISIYTGSDTMPFTRENVGASLLSLLPLIIICGCLIIGGFVLFIVLPPKGVRLRAKNHPEDTLSKLYPKLDLDASPESTKNLIKKEHTKRMAVNCTVAAAYVIGGIFALIYVLNIDNYPALEPTVGVRNGVLAILISLALPFGLSIAAMIINNASRKLELEAVKSALAAGHKKSGGEGANCSCKVKEFCKKNSRLLINIARCAVVIVAAAFIILGITLDGGAELSSVFKKAINICTECIGLG